MNLRLVYYNKDIPGFYNTGEFYRFFQAGFGGQPGLIDRTNITNKYNSKPVKTLYDYKIYQTNDKLCDLIDERASEIISLDKPTHVFWSGGIDSTVALVSLLKNASKTWIKDKLSMVFNYLSIEENPYIYGKLTKLDINLINIPRLYVFNYYRNTIYNDNLIVTGEMADQIMGSHFCFIHPEIALKPYKSTLTKYFELNSKFDDAKLKQFNNNEIFQCCEIIENKFNPYKLESLYDLLTFVNMFLTWDFNCNRYLSSNISLDNLYNFFNTEKFQNWGITNHFNKKYNLIKSKEYKIEYREYINSYFRDNYSYLMRKRTSPGTSSSMIKSKDNIIAVDSDFNFYYDRKIDNLKLEKQFNK